MVDWGLTDKNIVFWFRSVGVYAGWVNYTQHVLTPVIRNVYTHYKDILQHHCTYDWQCRLCDTNRGTSPCICVKCVHVPQCVHQKAIRFLEVGSSLLCSVNYTVMLRGYTPRVPGNAELLGYSLYWVCTPPSPFHKNFLQKITFLPLLIPLMCVHTAIVFVYTVYTDCVHIMLATRVHIC